MHMKYSVVLTTIWLWLIIMQDFASGAELVIQIPGNLGQDGVTYRLDYSPPFGHPAPNTTIASNDIQNIIKFSQAQPGTKYYFSLYYSNATYNTLTWTANFTTVPDPPSNLTIDVRTGNTVNILWHAPVNGSHSSFKLHIVPLNTGTETVGTDLHIENVDSTQYQLTDLVPGATYQVQVFTVFDSKESAAYISRNFTTKPNTPGKFIVWFRNETTLLVLWQPPYPTNIYTHYKVSIEPRDANESVLYVEKEGEPPGPAQAAFKGLVPGRAYNISVQTISEDKTSSPTTAQYRTIPLRPSRVYTKQIDTTSFTIVWEAPHSLCEFDTYHISIDTKKNKSFTRKAFEPSTLRIGNLQAGKTYSVLVKTVSGKVSSWPTSIDVTLEPLPVHDVGQYLNVTTGSVVLYWSPNGNSYQEAYLITYQEAVPFQTGYNVGDSDSLTTNQTQIDLSALLPGRLYNIRIQAVSKHHMLSNATEINVQTRPNTPILEYLQPTLNGLNISWKSDVNSQQDGYIVQYIRNDTDEEITTHTENLKIVLKDLYPGAGYLVRIYATSNNLKSEPYEHFQAVFPQPPKNMTIQTLTVNHILIQWNGPESALPSEYSLRYKTALDQTWIELPPVHVTEAELTNLTRGELYTIQVNTVSYNLQSNQPQQVNYTVPPNPVTEIAPLIDSNNVTLEWPRPEGRVDTYHVMWWRTNAHNLGVVNETTITQTHNEENRIVRLLVDDLMPGDQYSFRIRTKSNDLEGAATPLEIRTIPLIQSAVVLVLDPSKRDMIILNYTPTPQTSTLFDLYRFALSEPNFATEERFSNDTNRSIVFRHLIPGRLYNITMWTVSQNVSSQPLQRQDRLYPEPITSIAAQHISDTKITLEWPLPSGEFNAFEVQYLTAENILLQNLTVYNSMTITDLRPHRNYTFTIVVRSGTESSILRHSLPVSRIFETKESVPGKIERFEPTDIGPNEITFAWSLPPSEQNGVISKFTIAYNRIDDPESTETIQVFAPSSFQGRIQGLSAGKTYVFQIRGQTRIGSGPVTVYRQTMPILAPPKPSLQVVPTEVRKTTSTIQIRFRRNYFSDLNGPVENYAIVVAEDDSKNASGLEMPSWRDVQAYSIWPPYQVLEPFNPFRNSSVVEFTVGVESCSVRQIGYCNGPLKSGTTYRVKIRAFTAPDKFTDTNYSFPIRTDTDNSAVLLGVFVPLILFVVLFMAVIYLRRRRSLTRKKTTESTAPADTMSLPDSVIDTTRPTSIENFINHYRIMSADSDFRFSEEFEELKHVGRDQSCTFADLPCNRPKNRFTNILPYDHSRFKLQPVDDEEGSDYINANYVPGHNSPREFVVTQGPLHSTRDDFWRMVWESNSRAIVMLTRCVEKGREKCDHYWPYDTLPVYYGDISVQILNETRYPDWNILELMVSRNEQQRIVRHFHFTTWPDFGVPNPPHTLVRFVKAFRDRIAPDQRPIVVHCSAGVGRSGTFICLDRILQQILISDYVDIFGIVYAMRKERVWMVQTEQQYICIYQCLLAVLEGTVELANPVREIHDNQSYEDDEGIVESGM